VGNQLALRVDGHAHQIGACREGQAGRFEEAKLTWAVSPVLLG
jgi:hypothetical protein